MLAAADMVRTTLTFAQATQEPVRSWLSRRYRAFTGDEWDGDAVAEKYFPFISAERFTLRKFFRTPSMWFWFTKDQPDFEFEFLKDPK